MRIIEDTITPLSQAELNILHLESNVEDKSALTTSISKGLDRLYKVLKTLAKGIKFHMIPYQFSNNLIVLSGWHGRNGVIKPYHYHRHHRG